SVVQEASVEYEANLLQRLKELRRQLASGENVPAYIVLSDATLVELASYLPHTHDDISKISGFGEMKLKKYGEQFCKLIVEYCKEHQLASRSHLKSPKRPRKERTQRDNDTKQQTFKYFIEGNSVPKIAELRNLSPITIENHLAFYIQQGKLSVQRVMDAEKIPAIQQAIEQTGTTALTPIKESLGEEYSFGEIRYVMAHLEFFASAGYESF
ncbi:MAG: helix-turn-helix domain-containing protein, partial [Bacteroidota bacterium]